MQERRKTARWKINREGRFRLEGSSADAACHVVDINFKGIQLTLDFKLPIDNYVKFNVMFSSEFYLNVEAWVAWHKVIGNCNVYGLYFTKINDRDKERIYKFVYNNVPQEVTKYWWCDSTKKEGGEKMEDRRIFQRFNLRLPVKLLDLNNGDEIPAETSDISAKGMGLRINQALKVNTPLEAWVHVPDKGEPLYTRGLAVWLKQEGSNEYRVGMDLERADLMGLSRVLRA